MKIKTVAFACNLCCGIFKEEELTLCSYGSDQGDIHLCKNCLFKIVKKIDCWPFDCISCNGQRNLRTGNHEMLCTKCGPGAL